MCAGNGQPRDVTIKLGLPPENPPRDETLIGGRNPMTGARVENLSPAAALDLQMALTAKGVVIVSTGSGHASRRAMASSRATSSVR